MDNIQAYIGETRAMLDEMNGKMFEFRSSLGELVVTVHGSDPSESLRAGIDDVTA